MKTTKQFIDYCIHQHDVVCNQKYDRVHPYSKHLDDVYKASLLFTHLVNGSYWLVIDAIYGHDLIEDARVQYNEIKDIVGEEVAEIIYLCTENRGRTRADRKNAAFFNDLKTNELAVFVKLCDIIANTSHSKVTGSSMFKRYKEEYETKVRPYLYCAKYQEMFDYMDALYDLKQV